MISSPFALGSFQQMFCAQYGLAPELYDATVLRLTLYPHARWLADVRARGLLESDRRFVADIGRLTHWGGFAGEVREFQRQPENRRFWRRGLRLRVSVGRMRVLFSEVMGGTMLPAKATGRSADLALEPRDSSPATYALRGPIPVASWQRADRLSRESRPLRGRLPVSA